MSRLDLLPENDLVRRIAELRRIRDELKAGSQIFGSDSVVTQRVFSGNTSDIQATSIGFNNKVIQVTFTPTAGKSLVYKMEYTAVFSNADAVQVYVERQKQSGNTQVWKLYLSGSDATPTTTGDFKFYFYANGGGSFATQLV